MDPKHTKQNQFRLGLILIAVATGVLYQFVPYGQLILFPFTLLSTWVHEMGHGITALLCGGSFRELEIFSNAAGVAHISTPSPFCAALTDMGGLLAPPFLGMVILILARSWSRILLWVLSIAMILSLILWVRSLPGLITIASLSAVLVLIAIYGRESGRIWVSQFLGVVLVLFTVVRIDYLFIPNAPGSGTDGPSDIANLAQILGGPYQLWGVFLTGVSFIFLIFGLCVAWRSPNPRSHKKSHNMVSS